jgi:hypothetical protein
MFELIQYEETSARVHRRPLVVVPPQINKYYITDLAPGRSLVEGTVAAGIPYFTLSWRNPTAEHRDWNLDSYATAVLEAIHVACDIAGTDDANLVGICAVMIAVGERMTGKPLGPEARPVVEAMAEQEQRIVLRCRPYSTFAQPPRQVHRDDETEQLTHWISGPLDWNAPDPP